MGSLESVLCAELVSIFGGRLGGSVRRANLEAGA